MINLGGGYRVPRPHGVGPGGITEAPTAEEYAAAIGGRLRELDREHELGEPELLLEPGGYLVSDAAVLLARSACASAGGRETAPSTGSSSRTRRRTTSCGG